MEVLLFVLSVIIAFGAFLGWEGSSPFSAIVLIVLIWKCYYDYNRNKETDQRFEELSKAISNKENAKSSIDES
ncbi:MAG TPA: hypothetical protein DCR23_06910 [Ruminococcaceae bacterium]|nr:hypothetical protein [Oscillospiraceae bacterium]